MIGALSGLFHNVPAELLPTAGPCYTSCVQYKDQIYLFDNLRQWVKK